VVLQRWKHDRLKLWPPPGVPLNDRPFAGLPAARWLLHFAVSKGVLSTIRSSVLPAALWQALSGIASAPSFTATLPIVGEDREASHSEAVRGYLLAADERDGHANETPDGLLGGVDVRVHHGVQSEASNLSARSGLPLRRAAAPRAAP